MNWYEREGPALLYSREGFRFACLLLCILVAALWLALLLVVPRLWRARGGRKVAPCRTAERGQQPSLFNVDIKRRLDDRRCRGA